MAIHWNVWTWCEALSRKVIVHKQARMKVWIQSQTDMYTLSGSTFCQPDPEHNEGFVNSDWKLERKLIWFSLKNQKTKDERLNH